METAVLLPNVDYSRAVSINTEGLSMVLSTYTSVILSLQAKVDQFSSVIQRYSLDSLTDKESDYDDELIRIRSRLLKCERDSEKAKDVPDLQFEVKEMQFTLSKLESGVSDHTNQLHSYHESFQTLVSREYEVKEWVDSKFQEAKTEFKQGLFAPFQQDLEANMKAQMVRLQEDLKQGMVAIKQRSVEIDGESPQVITNKLTNLNVRMKRLEDSAMYTECNMGPEYDHESLEKLSKEFAEMASAIKILQQKSGDEAEKVAKKPSRMTFGSASQSGFIQKIEEIQHLLDSKASLEQLLALEGNSHSANTMQKIESIIKLLATRNHIKNDILVQKVQELEERITKANLTQGSEDALLAKKQLLQCASCSQDLKETKGHVGFTPWRKMTLAEGVGRRSSSQLVVRPGSSAGK